MGATSSAKRLDKVAEYSKDLLTGNIFSGPSSQTVSNFQVHKLKLEPVYMMDIPFFDFDLQMEPWTFVMQVVCACFM